MELKTQEKNGLLLMPTAKVTKNVSAAVGGGNVLCSTLISIKTKAWLYFFRLDLFSSSLTFLTCSLNMVRVESTPTASTSFS